MTTAIRSAIAGLVSVVLLGSMSCAKVELRYAMNRVQREQRALDDRIEAQRLSELPEHLDELEAALRDERITSSPTYRNEQRFRTLYDEMLGAISEFREGLSTGRTSDLAAYQATLSLACSSCHDVYRSP